jgi:maltose O-acetyltransferase
MKREMLAGAWYAANDPEISADLERCAQLMARYNASSTDTLDRREQILRQILGGLGTGTVVRPPIYFDLGYQTTIGSRTFVNVGAVILDIGRVTIGDDVQIGPNVQLLTPIHPMAAAERRAGWQAQKRVTVGNGVWLAGGVIVCPGVTIGDDAVIGAGAVVTRDVPPRVFAAGNPCRVIRPLD